MGYYPCVMATLTRSPYRAGRQCQMGSLTGAVASQIVTEAPKGSLSADRNRTKECKGRRELDCESYNSSRDESRA